MWRDCKIIITFVHSNIFLEKLLKLVIKQSCVSLMRWMEVQRGQFKFHTFIWTFILRWHLCMKGMPTWMILWNYERRLRSNSCSDDFPMFKKKLQTFINAFYTWCIFQRHKIEYQESLTWMDQKVLKLGAYLHKYTTELHQTYTVYVTTISWFVNVVRMMQYDRGYMTSAFDDVMHQWPGVENRPKLSFPSDMQSPTFISNVAVISSRLVWIWRSIKGTKYILNL